MPSLDTITIDGVDYDLVDSGRPTALKNPNALTFTGAVTGSYDGSEAVTVNVPNADLSTVVKKAGDRGMLYGYEQTGSVIDNVTQSSPDSAVSGNALTVGNGVFGASWTKVVLLTAASSTVTLGSSWVWKDGEAPTINQNDFLVCTWIFSRGIASIISGSAS